MTIKRYTIYGIFTIALFGGLMKAVGIPRVFNASTEALIYLLIILALIARFGKGITVPHLWYSFTYMLLIAACSIAVNDTEISRAIFSIRSLYRFYFFYIGLTLLDLDDNNIRKINRFLGILMLLQLPVVAIKFSIYGIKEATQGAYTRDGALTTMLPIVVIFYLSAFYYLYRPKLWYIVSGIGFVLFSIAGAKRAVFFLYPFQFLSIYYYIYVKGTAARLSKSVGALILITSLITVISGSILYFNKSLNPEGKVGGSIDLDYALDYAGKYNLGEDWYGYSFGRVATTIRVYENLWNLGVGGLLFGAGPGCTTPSMFDTREEKNRFWDRYGEFKIGYGLTAMSRIALEYGVLGVVAYSLIVFLLVRMCLKYYKKEIDPYWKAFAAGSVGFAFSMIFFSFAYQSTAIWGDTFPVLYFYAMSVVYTRLKRISGRPIEAETNI